MGCVFGNRPGERVWRRSPQPTVPAFSSRCPPRPRPSIGRTTSWLRIGLAQAAAIHYRVLTTYLTSFSSYVDHANGLNQACADLLGTNGITGTMCIEVAKTVSAVEMMAAATRCEATPPPLCSTGAPTPAFSDGFETTTSNWTATSTGVGTWSRKNNLARTGTYGAFGANVSTISDHRYTMTQPVVVPPNAWMYFDHRYAFEEPAYDGGVIEVSNDNGATWWDAGGYIDAGAGYTGVVDTAWGNPLAGRSAFVGERFAYVGTRLNLAAFAGFSVKFRFRLGTDGGVSAPGWAIDNVSLYTCNTSTPPPGEFSKVGPNDGIVGLQRMLLGLSWQPTLGSTGYEYCLDTTNDNACAHAWSAVGGQTSVMLMTAAGTTYYWQVRAIGPGGTTLANGGQWWRFQTGPPWSDLNADGKPDIVFQNQTSGVMYSWFLGGPAGTTLVGESLLPATTTNWTLVGKDDFTKDGKVDFLWQDTASTAVRLWEMNGTTLVNESILTAATGPWTVVATGDINKDGRPDIIYQQLATGRLYAWLMDGTALLGGGPILDVADQWGLADVGWRVVGLADFNIDAQNDLIWQHTDGRVRVWYLNGLKEASTSAIFAGTTPWRVRMTTDLNGSLSPDILWQNPSGVLCVWFLSGTTVVGDGFVTPPQVAAPWKVVGGK